MKQTIKAFCVGKKRKELIDKYGCVVEYDGFILLEVSKAAAKKIASLVPIENITNHFTILSGTEQIDTSVPRVSIDGKVKAHSSYKRVRKVSSGPHHHLVQFVGPIKKSWLTKVKKLGGIPRQHYGNYVYVVRCDEQTLFEIIELPFVRWAGHLSHHNRLHSSVDQEKKGLPRSRFLPLTHIIEFFDRSNMDDGTKELKKQKVKVLSSTKLALTVTILIEGTRTEQKKILKNISAIHGVSSIRNRNLKRTNNDVATEIMQGDSSVLELLGWTGKGEIVAVCDTGLDSGDTASMHPDFTDRITAIKSYPINPDFDPFINNPGGNDGPSDLDSGHGTHVAGSVLGNGKASRTDSNQTPIRALAHEANLVFQAIEQEVDWKSNSDEAALGRFLLAGIPNNLNTLFLFAYNKGARIHSNSWGGGDPGVYDDQSRQLDEFVWKKKDMCIVVAAGNDGTDVDENGVADGKINMTSVTSPATAKNCITVGASESVRPQFNGNRYGDWWPDDYPISPIKNDPMANDSGDVVAFSSRGPTLDGRTKPDVVAPGTFILSARSRFISPSNKAWAAFPSNKHYFFMGGTSMATPLVSGGVAVVRQYIRDAVGIVSPSAALLKASLILSAQKLPGQSPTSHVSDSHQGYGLVSIQSIINPPAPTKVWFYDQHEGLNTGQVEEIEIDVQSSSIPMRIVMAYTDAPGKFLVNNLNLMLEAPDGSHSIGNANGLPLTSDTTNNVEVINVTNPLTGKWKLRIVGSNVPKGPQDFAIVFSGDVV